MECQLCMENFNHDNLLPVILQCGHTICKLCLKKIKSQSNHFCPFDRKPIKSSENLQINFYLLDLIDHPPKQSKTSSKSANNPSLLCPQSHNLQSSLEMRDQSELLAICSYCETKCLSTNIKCQECSFQLCEGCSQDEVKSEKQSERRVFCLKNHELKRYSNTSFFYSKKRKQSRRIRCNLCQSSYYGGSWCCRLCHFDLCLTCFDRTRKGFGLVCDQGHLLDPLIVKSDQVVYCSLCDARRSSLFFECSLCAFNLCEKCVDYETRTEKDETVACPAGHPVVFTEDPKTGFSELFESFQCSTCKDDILEDKSFHCLKCKFLLCKTCCSCIRNASQSEVKVRCLLGHPLDYVFNIKEIRKRNLICDICRCEYRCSGSFSCLDCKFDVCVKCVGLDINK